MNELSLGVTEVLMNGQDFESGEGLVERTFQMNKWVGVGGSDLCDLRMLIGEGGQEKSWSKVEEAARARP